MKQECILHSNSNSEFEKNLKSGSKQEAELNYDLELKVLVELQMFEGITEKVV